MVEFWWILFALITLEFGLYSSRLGFNSYLDEWSWPFREGTHLQVAYGELFYDDYNIEEVNVYLI